MSIFERSKCVAIRIYFLKGREEFSVDLEHTTKDLINKNAESLLQMVSEDVRKNMNAAKNAKDKNALWVYRQLNAKLYSIQSTLESGMRGVLYAVIWKKGKPLAIISDIETNSLNPRERIYSRLEESLLKEYLQKDVDGTYYLNMDFELRICV